MRNLLAFCSIVFLLAGSQEKLSFEGYVRDAQTGKPLEGASVIVAPKNQKKLVAIRTDKDGHYRVTLPRTNEATKIHYGGLINYESKTIEVTVTKEECKKHDYRIKASDVVLKKEIKQ